MIPEQTLLGYPVFGDNATKVEPDNNKKSNGWQQGDVVPAEWMNWEWYHTSKGVADLNKGVTSMEKEINNVLSEAGITPAELNNTQLFKAIQKNNGCIITAAANPKTIIGAPTIQPGSIIKIMFGADVIGNDNVTGLTISYNGTDYLVKVCKNSELIDFTARKIEANLYKYLQRYTTLEIVYDGVYFVIIGNPLVLSTPVYKAYADGEIEDTYSNYTGTLTNINSQLSDVTYKLIRTGNVVHLTFEASVSQNLAGRNAVLFKIPFEFVPPLSTNVQNPFFINSIYQGSYGLYPALLKNDQTVVTDTGSGTFASVIYIDVTYIV